MLRALGEGSQAVEPHPPALLIPGHRGEDGEGLLAAWDAAPRPKRHLVEEHGARLWVGEVVVGLMDHWRERLDPVGDQLGVL